MRDFVSGERERKMVSEVPREMKTDGAVKEEEEEEEVDGEGCGGTETWWF